MKHGPNIAPVAALIGDPARANMLVALMDGGSLTAGELAEEAGVTPSTASSHLAKLRAGGLVAESKHGRNRYFAISDSSIAGLLENLMGVSQQLGHVRHQPSSKAPALRCSRVCYDHLAGQMGVWMFERLHDRRLTIGHGERLRLTRKGAALASQFGIDIAALASKRQALCRPCRDWSEHRDHLGGLLGSAFLNRFFELKWARREAGTRIVRFSSSGEACFRALLA